MSSYTGDELGKDAQTTAEVAKDTAKVAKKTAKAAVKAGKGAAKLIAFLMTPAGQGALLAVLLAVLILIAGTIVTAAPSVIWNAITHVDTNLDPGKTTSEELKIDDNTLKSREQEWADIITEEVNDTHDDIMKQIEAQCKKDGVDYEATKENIVDSTDFLGSQESEDASDDYKTEQQFYQIFKDKGYSEITAITLVSAMDYLTEVDPTYNINDDTFNNVKLTGNKESVKSGKYLTMFSQEQVGALKFSKSDFVSYIRNAYGKTTGKGKKQTKKISLKTLKSKMPNPKVQADYADMLLKHKLSQKNLKTLKKTKSIKNATKIIVAQLPMLANNTGTINTIKSGAEKLKEGHKINPDKNMTFNSSGGSKNATGTSSSSDSVASGSFMDTMDKLAKNFAKYKFHYSVNGGKANYKKGLNTNRKVNCANYVCWGLQESGLVPKNTMIWCGYGKIHGNAKSRKIIKNKKNFYVRENVDSSLGSLVSSGKLKPGDIVGAQGKAHTMVYRGKIKGKYTFFSVGRKATNSHIPSRITNNHRNKSWRVGVIIRPKKAGTVEKSSGASSTDVKEQTRAKNTLAKIRAKSNYPASTIKAHKKSALAAYKKNKKTINSCYKALRSAGLSPSAAAGIMGNAWQESGWNSTVVSGDGHGSQGLIQWTGGRKTAMKSWIKKKGGNWKNLVWQAKFAAHEIKTSESGSFSGSAGNVTSYGKGFFSVKPYKSYKAYAASDDPLRATVVYCACIERCAINASNMENRYAGTEVILEQCAGIKGGTADDELYGDSEGELQAGSRQVAMILSAFSVKESQLLPVEKQMKLSEKESENITKAMGAGDKLQSFLKKRGIVINDGATNFINIVSGAATSGYYKVKNAIRDMRPKHTLRKALRDNKAKLYDVHYGEIVKDKKGRKIYANIEISPASANTIAKSVFGLNPKGIYQTSDEKEPIGAKDTTVSQAITTMTDNHMELLYGNHEYGGSAGDASISLIYNGSGRVGNPLGTKKITLGMITSFFGPRPYPGAGGSTNHGGMDISYGGCYGDPVYSGITGKVTRASSFSGFGNCIEVTDSKGMMIRYGHLSKISVKAGKTVKKGQKVGEIGSTGNSTGPHLHIEVHIGGKGVDPLPYLFKYTKGVKKSGNKQKA